jgi:phosphoribosylformimino-5-aminoimidazole carboxamide ribotide isomerase
MLIIPAIDIKAGSCVRLVQGDMKQMTVYSSDPIEIAKTWVRKGAKRLHIVDLDGALSGRPHHLSLVEEIKKETHCEIQFGGGLRDKDVVKQALDMGIEKLILGTAALDELPWIKSALEWHPERFMVAIDALKDAVAREGWQEDSTLTIIQALKKMETLGFKETIYTDISRDGTLQGPNFDSIQTVVEETRLGVYASGGISSIEDVKKLKQIHGLQGVVIGKALYAGKIKLEDCYAI